MGRARPRAHQAAHTRSASSRSPAAAAKRVRRTRSASCAGYKVFADKVTGSKEVRAEPFAAQVQGGNVWLIAGPWQPQYLDELEQFPSGKFRDQVDASTGAFNRLVSRPSYNLDALAS